MLGDGWLGIWASPARFAAAVEEISAIAHDAGRDDAPSRHAMQVWCAFGEPDVARDRLARSMERLYRIPFDKFAATARRGRPATSPSSWPER